MNKRNIYNNNNNAQLKHIKEDIFIKDYRIFCIFPVSSRSTVKMYVSTYCLKHIIYYITTVLKLSTK